MMKYLSFLLFVAASQAYVTGVAREVEDLPVPHLTSITLVDDPSLAFVVEWTPVESSDDSLPILGYKLKVWEQPKIKQYKYVTVNGIKMLVEEYVPTKFSSSDKVPTHKPREFIINSGEKTIARVGDIEAGVTYETRVQAFTRNGDGPLSDPMRVEVASKENESQRDLYTME